jgi:DNA polymerase I-like protein with 3'-5' exonuclease and polymerase domains
LTNGYSQDVLGRRRYYEILDPRQIYGSESSPFYRRPRAEENDEGSLRVTGLKQGKDYYREVMSALRKSQNHPIQGSAAEMTKQGSIFAERRFSVLPFRAKIVGFVHDEIITVCPKNKDHILTTVSEITKAMTEDIPLIEKYGFPDCLKMAVGVSAGDNWGGAMSIDKYLDTF